MKSRTKQYSHEFKLLVINEYLSGPLSYREVGMKYAVSVTTIRYWVRNAQKAIEIPIEKDSANSADVKVLQEELKKAKLQNQLLKEILRLSEEYTGIDLRKKYGTRQS